MRSHIAGASAHSFEKVFAAHRIASAGAFFRVVDEAKNRRFIALFAALNMILLVAYLVAITGLVHDEYTVREREKALQLLQERQDQLTLQEFALSTPERLEIAAAELGLVPLGPATYLAVPEPTFAHIPAP